jgi:hypothetical protein
LCNRLNRISARKNLSWNLALPIVTIGVVGIHQMVFTNSITATHGNMTIDQPPISLMVVRGCKSVNAMYSKGGYWEPIVVTTPILDHKDGHYIRPNKVALKYFDFRKDVDPNVHVRLFNSTVKINAETSKIYTIIAFSYTLRDTTSKWYHNYMWEFLEYIFSKLTQAFYKCHWKIQNDKQIYMELKNMK